MSASVSVNRRTPTLAVLASGLALALGIGLIEPGPRSALATPMTAVGSVFASAGAATWISTKSTEDGIAATIVVNNCDDLGAGSLRAAAAAAVSGDTIDLSELTCSVITLTSGAVILTADDVFIQGSPNGTLSIDGNGSDRVFDHQATGTLSVARLAIRNGSLISTDPDQYSVARGGCINSAGAVVLDHTLLSSCAVYGLYNTRGGAVAANSVELTDSRVEDSSVESSDLVPSNHAGYANGGAIYASSRISMIRSTVSGNSASSPLNGAHGGGIGSYSGPIEIADSTLDGNVATGRTYVPTTGYAGFSQGIGGAVFVGGSYLNVSGSTLSGNTASSGGAIAITFAPPGSTIENSTLSGNVALSKGGGVWAFFGGISFINSTVVSNQATYGGGGLMPQHALYTVYDNPPTLESTVVAGNTSLYFHSDIQSELPGLTITGSHNLVDDSGITLPADTLTGDPMLLPLADNGGPTPTRAPAPGSPVVDAGNNSTSLAFDQRGSGFPRTVGSATDIGAVEYQPQQDTIFDDGFD